MSTALRGVRVLDLADRSAALAGRVLADLGAEVVLVEPPDGNPLRRLAPFLDDRPGPERSFHHLVLAANKKSVVLEDGLRSDRFERLVASADLLIDTARPGQRDGLDHQTLRELNPALIQLSITPFGLADGAGRKANDLVAGAAGGLVWLSGEPRGIPVQGAAHPSYCMAGLAAASAATIALIQRERAGDGPGLHVDLSLQEATVMAVMQTATPSHWSWFGRIPRRPGLSNALRCADGGYVGLLVRPDRFGGFLAWCEREGVEHGMSADDWPWARIEAPRKDNPVSAATLALASRLGRDAFVAGALEADIVCLPVLDFDDLATHEQFTSNQQFQGVHHEALGRELSFVRSPVDAMADGVEFRPAPRLGQHTDELLAGLPAPKRRPLPATTPPAPERALEAIRVVDFGWVLAAPIGTRLLASFGAEVIRVESSRKPDSARSTHGPSGKPDPDLGGLFNSVNAGKKSLSVDLTTEAGLALVKDLIARSDVVVNNFRPGALERMGLGYDVLCALRRDVILLNLPGAHRKGPWSVRASLGNILMAASGFNLLTGFPGERPRGIGIAYPDFTAPHLLVACVLAALRQRDRTGRGQELHATQLSSLVSLLGVEWMQYAATGVQPPRNANRDPNHCPHGVFPAAGDDQWVALAVSGDGEWAALCALMGEPLLARDPRFSTHAARKTHEEDLDRQVRAWTADRDKWACAELLQGTGIAAAPVEDLSDTFERDPLLRAHYQIVHQPVAPDIEIPIDREVARWVGSEHRLRRSPALGEHNEDVVCGILGRSEDEYARLVLDGVLA